jgi:xanthine dehydrogenase accessory factor
VKLLDLYSRKRSILCVVAETSGSCPGKTGFKMAVPDKDIPKGSIGGGEMERLVIEQAQEMLKENASTPLIRTFRHSPDADPEQRTGMICSGYQRIILVPHPPANALTNETRSFRISPAGLEFLTSPMEKEGFTGSKDYWEYRENLKLPPVVYIFGGGHCSRALTPILASLGMRAVILDDREGLHTMEENEDAWQRITMDYSQAASIVPDNGQGLVVIMTDSHVHDARVLELMLPLNLRYLGMMASRSTADHVLKEMEMKGFTREALSRVHTPVGIPIGSHTPAEIAVSIAAEIIRELNSGS